jgi:protein gp37
MTSTTKIEWTNHTFNPWWGCSRVSPACRHCYADTTATRWGHELWRRKGPRKMMSDANWRNPLKWNRDAEQSGRPARVFCASMADVFEVHPVAEVNSQLDTARARLWALIDRTPWLVWQLLTKRPENVAALAPWGSGWPSNVWLGTSVEDQRWADTRIPALLDTPAAVRFISAEPLLGPVDLLPHLAGKVWPDTTRGGGGVGGQMVTVDPSPLGWVIVGGESGPGARPMRAEWARRIVDDCAVCDVPVFVKQLGSAYGPHKGGDMDTWPADVRVREFPRTVVPS